MLVLTTEERQAFSSFCLKIGSGAIALLYGTLSGQPAAGIAGESALTAAAKVMDYVMTDPATCIAACDWIEASYPADPQLLKFIAIRTRLQAQLAQQAADPIDEVWIGAEPMVNRASLRALLREIANGFLYSVVYIVGGPGSGRSHSWQLIRHIARRRGVPYHLCDFYVPTDERTIGHLFGKLRRAYNSVVIEEPTTIAGKTPVDAAQTYVTKMRDALQNENYAGPGRWVVIDFSDEVADPVVPEFIKLLCAERDNNAFDSCVFFVLGPLAHLETMRDLLTMQVEELGPVTQTEILAAARAVNARGMQKLDDAQVQNRVSTMYGAVSALPEQERYPAVRRQLLKLRNEVRAP